VEGRVGREYLRVSWDRSGRERSQDEQHAENARACADRGITLSAGYREAGSASASRYARKTRDDFRRLLTDLEAGRFGADVLVLWESSRGSRKVGEWVTLIELCESAHVSILVTTHGREYDPANARDRRSLLEDAVDSEYESSKVSARVKRTAAANAAAGRPHGQIPFGYRRRYDERTRELVAQEPHPVEAPVAVELFARLRAGHTLAAIARDFAARGIRNDSGTPFSPQHLRALALTATYAAIRLHRPRQPGVPRTRSAIVMGAPGVTATPGTWPGLVSVEEYLAVREILTDPARITGKPGKARHLLSMIARCGVCGAPLAVTYRGQWTPTGGQYQCHHGGHVRVSKPELDAYAQDAILGYLARPDVHAALTTPPDGAGAELASVRERLAVARAELGALRDAVAAGTLSVATLVSVEPGLLARIDADQAEETRLVTPSFLHGLITPGADVAARWAQMPISAQREVARTLLTPSLLGALHVNRRPAGSAHLHVPAPDRVAWIRDNTTPNPSTHGDAVVGAATFVARSTAETPART
jgi:DNA invertase Pin-like site-specific DNA recombinase